MATGTDIDIEKLKQGDPIAFRALVQTYRQEVFGVCYRILLNTDDADDTAQEVFAEVYRSVKDFRGESSLVTWLYRIATNKSLNLLKRRTKFSLWSVFDDEITSPPDTTTASDAIELSETERAVHEALATLSPEQRTALTLHRFEELSYTEIAHHMNITVNAVGVLINRARNKVREYLQHFFNE